jgi:biopolymer transport protein ExbD
MANRNPTLPKFEVESPDQGLASPLNLRIAYQVPRNEMDLLPFLDLVLIGFLFFMLSSRMVFAPGILVNTPQGQNEVLQSVLVSDVLTVSKRGDNLLFFFRGAIYDFDGLEQYALANPAASVSNHAVILLKLDRDLPIELQTELLRLMRHLGYGKAHVAVEPAQT